jgi:hypothetical protein
LQGPTNKKRHTIISSKISLQSTGKSELNAFVAIVNNAAITLGGDSTSPAALLDLRIIEAISRLVNKNISRMLVKNLPETFSIDVSLIEISF